MSCLSGRQEVPISDNIFVSVWFQLASDLTLREGDRDFVIGTRQNIDPFLYSVYSSDIEENKHFNNLSDIPLKWFPKFVFLQKLWHELGLLDNG